jgi:asparagine synthase (glutamine-hydrolysing)
MDQPLREVIDLTHPESHFILNMSLEQARQRVSSGDPQAVREIQGHFAVVARHGQTVRMARSIGRLMRYFIAKKVDGPVLIVAETIAEIRSWLRDHDMQDQFHATYTRMVPAHHLTEIELVGCPDPNPVYRRFFDPPQDALGTDLDDIGRRYITALAETIDQWLDHVPENEPIGVPFSGGIDSGAVLLTLYHQLKRRSSNLGRLKAFTLSLDDSADDLVQARAFLDELNMGMFLEPITASVADIDVATTIDIVEDYKPLDIQAAAVLLALVRGIRAQYPEWTYLIDGDGGDENLKDYPIDINPELTIRSVLNNQMLYQEGWGVDSIKHSLTFSGGQSRGAARTIRPLSHVGFIGFSPFAVPEVIAVAEAIPYRTLTDFDVDTLYALKGRIVSAGVRAVTGVTLPVFEKRRFQDGVGRIPNFSPSLAVQEQRYRRLFEQQFRDTSNTAAV